MREPRSPRRSQFSLLNLLLAATAVAACAGLYASWQTIRHLKTDHAAREAELVTTHEAVIAPLREENAKLRAEQGALTIDDPTRVHAIRLPELMENIWQYRVYLPPGRDYYVAGQANELPVGEALNNLRYGSQPPGPSMSETSRSGIRFVEVGHGEPAGEILVTVQLGTNQDGKKTLRLASGPAGSPDAVTVVIPSENDQWPSIEKEERLPDEPSRYVSIGGVWNGRQVAEEAERLPLVLLDYRVMHSGVTTTAEAKDGILVWVGRTDESNESSE